MSQEMKVVSVGLLPLLPSEAPLSIESKRITLVAVLSHGGYISIDAHLLVRFFDFTGLRLNQFSPRKILKNQN